MNGKLISPDFVAKLQEMAAWFDQRGLLVPGPRRRPRKEVPPIWPAEYWADLDGPSSPSGGGHQLVTISNPDSTRPDETKLWTLAGGVLTCVQAGRWRIEAQHTLDLAASQGTANVTTVPSTVDLVECSATGVLVAYVDTGGGFVSLGNAAHVESNTYSAGALLTARYVYPAFQFDAGDELKIMAGSSGASGWNATDGYLMLSRLSE